MDQAWASIVVAVIGVIGSILTVQFSKMRKENRDDHGYVREALENLHYDVKEVSNKVDSHIDWHLKSK